MAYLRCILYQLYIHGAIIITATAVVMMLAIVHIENKTYTAIIAVMMSYYRCCHNEQGGQHQKAYRYDMFEVMHKQLKCCKDKK